MKFEVRALAWRRPFNTSVTKSFWRFEKAVKVVYNTAFYSHTSILVKVGCTQETSVRRLMQEWHKW